MRGVVEYLIELKHKKIAVVMRFFALHDRFRCSQALICEVMVVHGFALSHQEIVDGGGLDASSGRIAYQKLLQRGVKASASAFEPPITSVDTTLEIHAQEVAKAMLAALRQGQAIHLIRRPTYLRIRKSTDPIARKFALKLRLNPP